MKWPWTITTLMLGMLLVRAQVGSAYTQDTQPATLPGAQPLKATITGVEGIVQVRNSDSEPWKKAAVGMVLDEGAEFRTGPKSAVRFTIPPDQTVTLDRLGTVKLLEAIKSGTKVKTDLGMKYGRVRYDIEAAGEEHDATIHSPGSTLAVRGTQVSVTNEGSFAVEVVSLTGVARVKDAAGREVSFGSSDGQRAEVVEGTTGAAQTALNLTFVDPSIGAARTNNEQQAILARPTNVFVTSSPDITDAAPPPPVDPMPEPPPPTGPGAPGSVVFQLVWIQSEKQGVAPDLDLFVLSPRGEELTPKGTRQVPSGGRLLNDDTGGGKPFRFAQEVVVWPQRFPEGDYQFGVDYVQGGPGEFQLIVLKDGELIIEPLGGTADARNPQTRERVNITRNTQPLPDVKPPVTPPSTTRRQDRGKDRIRTATPQRNRQRRR